MSDAIKARAASIRAQGGQLTIVLTFDHDGKRQRVEHAYAGDDVKRFAGELLRQLARGEVLELKSDKPEEVANGPR